ncbi:MAG: ribonuclease III [Armatimonadetes bacterium]|nr:ribonuclease III [Armatimonadota bacterium]
MSRNPWRKLRAELSLPPLPEPLLQQAFQHGSYVREQGLEPLASNQRLEFLGDAVLDLIVADHLFRHHPEASEGLLTRQKASVVRADALAATARALGLGQYLLLGHGEAATGGRDKTSLLAETLEALIGAIYLAGGFEAAREFVLKHIPLPVATGPRAHMDSKSHLQELLQAHGRRPPCYRIVDTSGPPHATTFRTEVWSGDLLLGRGTGRSKRESEQQAAAEALATVDQWLPKLGREG